MRTASGAAWRTPRRAWPGWKATTLSGERGEPRREPGGRGRPGRQACPQPHLLQEALPPAPSGLLASPGRRWGHSHSSFPLIAHSCPGSQRFGPCSRAGEQARRRSSPQSCGLGGQAGASPQTAGGEALWPRAQPRGPQRGLGGRPVRPHRMLAGGLLVRGLSEGPAGPTRWPPSPRGAALPAHRVPGGVWAVLPLRGRKGDS